MKRSLIEEYVEDLNADSTRTHSKSMIRVYLRYIYGLKPNKERTTNGELTPEEVSQLDECAVKYVSEQRDYEHDIVKFFQEGVNFRNKTMLTYYGTIRQFLEKNGIVLKNGDKLKNKFPKHGARTRNVSITMDLVKKLLMNSPLSVRSLILVAVTTGMRINSIVHLKNSDITPMTTKDGTIVYKVWLNENYEKMGHETTTFLTKEAYDHLQEWNAYRPMYLEYKRKAGENGLKKDNGYIFEFTAGTASKMLRTVLKNCNLLNKDVVTGKFDIHFHLFRGFFRRQLIQAGIPEDVVENYIHFSKSSYDKYSDEELAEWYVKGQKVLITGIDHDIDEKNRRMAKIIADLQVTLQSERETTDNLGRALGEVVLLAFQSLKTKETII